MVTGFNRWLHDRGDNYLDVRRAGHVVAQFRLGIEQGRASIAPDGQSAGHVLVSGWIEDGEDPRNYVISHCAGYAACRAADLPNADSGCGNDFAAAKGLIDSLGLGCLADWQARAVEWMSLPKNVKAVSLIAKHLLRWETLNVEYMDCLLDVADGEITEAEFEQYCKNRSAWDPGFAERYLQFRE